MKESCTNLYTSFFVKLSLKYFTVFLYTQQLARVARRFIIEREHTKRRSREEPPAGMTYIFHCGPYRPFSCPWKCI